MTLTELLAPLVDFLFPKSAEVRALEALSPAELLSQLPPAAVEDEDVVALFAYHHPQASALVWELKYRGNRLVAKKLALILLDVLRHELADRLMFENFIDPLLVPMPISTERLRERGYNQTEVLARELMKLDTDSLFSYIPRALAKIVHTSTQTRHSRAERLENLKGSMRVTDPESVRGRCVIVLDDVTTTGATFAEAKRALREAGARKVLCVAVAAS